MTWEELYAKYGDGVYKEFIAVFLKNENGHICISCWKDGSVAFDYSGEQCISHIKVRGRTYDQMEQIIQGLK